MSNARIEHCKSVIGGSMKKVMAIILLFLLFVNPVFAQSASLLPNGEQQFIDENGDPYAGGFVYFYVPNTDTPKDTWQDPDQDTLNTNPVELDSAGRAIIYGSGQYRQLLKDVDGNTIWDQLTSSTGVTQTTQAIESTGSPNAYNVDYPSVPTELVVGSYYNFIANFQNTSTTPTLDINDLGGHVITKNGTLPLASGDICDGMVVSTVWDGTQFQMVNPPCNGATISAVTQVSAGTGISVSPSPIVATGSVALAAIADDRVLGNISGGSTAPTAITGSDVLDMIGTTRGSVLYRGASGWSALTPGTSTYVLTSNGPGADPSYQQLGSGLVLLSTVTASNSASVSFNSTYLTSTYKSYKIVFDGVAPTNLTDVSFILQISTNNGSSYITSGYNNQGTVSSLTNGVDIYGDLVRNNDGGGVNVSGYNGVGEILFSRPSEVFFPMFKVDTSTCAGGNSGDCSSLTNNNSTADYGTATSFNNVRLLFTSGNVKTGTFRLFGISGT